jgi:hypothetical protein
MSKNGPSSSGTAPEWFLKVEQTQTGPYTAEQIVSLLREGEILPHHQVTCARLQGKWITANELAHAFGARSPRPFMPPPRPDDIGEVTGFIERKLAEQEDPAHALFEALQVAREKRSGITLLPNARARWKPKFFGKISPQLWLIGATTAVLVTALIGLALKASRQPEPARSTAEKASAKVPTHPALAPKSTSRLRTFSHAGSDRNAGVPPRPAPLPMAAPHAPAPHLFHPTARTRSVPAPAANSNWRRAEINRGNDLDRDREQRDIREREIREREEQDARDRQNDERDAGYGDTDPENGQPNNRDPQDDRPRPDQIDPGVNGNGPPSNAPQPPSAPGNERPNGAQYPDGAQLID